MNADYKGYLGSYTNNDPQNEIGYNLLVHLFNGLGLPFESILLLLGILVFCFLLLLPTSSMPVWRLWLT